MSVFDRRELLGLAAKGTLAGIGAAVLGQSGSRALASAVSRTHFRAVVIGSGFGGSVTALRLGEAGVDTLVLERGQEWHTSPSRAVFGAAHRVTDANYWFRRTTSWPLTLPSPIRPTAGVMEVSQEGALEIACAAAVGGGSVVYTGVTLAPPRRYFERLYPSGLKYQEFATTWYPKVKAMLGASAMPRDVYHSAPFTHSRVWDQQLRKAGHTPTPLDSIFDWDIIRQELAGSVRPSAIIGESDFGCSNGAKKSLTRNYLPKALETGKVQLRPLHEVRSIGRKPDGRYSLEVRRLRPDGSTVDTDEYTCEQLFVSAGTLNTNRLLLAARESGALPDLPAALGTGFGDNGDQLSVRSDPLAGVGPSQGAPSASGVFFHNEFAMPLLAENWVVTGFGPLPITATLTMTVDTDNRGTFRYNPLTRKVSLDWPVTKHAPAFDIAVEHNLRVMAANPGSLPVALTTPWVLNPHPLGGCVIGRCTDLEGRVKGNKGLYVIDGSLIPGNVGGANPSFTIAAIAERALSAIVAAGG